MCGSGRKSLSFLVSEFSQTDCLVHTKTLIQEWVGGSSNRNARQSGKVRTLVLSRLLRELMYSVRVSHPLIISAYWLDNDFR